MENHNLSEYLKIAFEHKISSVFFRTTIKSISQTEKEQLKLLLDKCSYEQVY